MYIILITVTKILLREGAVTTTYHAVSLGHEKIELKSGSGERGQV